MRINSYKFGEIEIDGELYKHDILISQGKVDSWWR